MVSNREIKIQEYFNRLKILSKDQLEHFGFSQMYQKQYEKSKDIGFGIPNSLFLKRKEMYEESAKSEQEEIGKLIMMLPQIEREIDIVIGELAPRVAVLKKMGGNITIEKYLELVELEERLAPMQEYKAMIAEGNIFGTGNQNIEGNNNPDKPDSFKGLQTKPKTTAVRYKDIVKRIEMEEMGD